jgi:pimeloyl-ACP methyl ester carboxylesterase
LIAGFSFGALVGLELAARTYELDMAVLQRSGARVVVAAGSTDGDFWIHHGAEALARALKRPLVEFPGGHNGFVTHPRGFAARLREVLMGALGEDLL